MEILGHSTIAVTQNIYGHVMPEAVSTATAAVADLL
jgi:integrase